MECEFKFLFDRAEKRLRMRHLRPDSAGKSRLEQQIPNVKQSQKGDVILSIFYMTFESFSFPKRFIYLLGIAFSGPYR